MTWFTAILVALCSALSLSAAANRYVIHLNQDIAILAMAEGPDEDLWLAALDGLYRFDGFHYQKIREFPFRSARYLAFTRDGALWVGGPEGIARESGRRFDVVIHEFVVGFVSVGERILVVTPQRSFAIDLAGTIHDLPYFRGGHYTVSNNGELWISFTNGSRAYKRDPLMPERVLEQVELPGGFQQVARDSRGQLWAATLDRVVPVAAGKPVFSPAAQFERKHSQKVPRPYPLVSGRNGQLWFLGETVHALIGPQTFRDRSINDQFLPTAGLEDSRGHFWLARMGQGLIEWIPDSRWERWFPEDFGGLAAAQVARAPNGEIFAATRNNIYRLRSGTWVPISGEEREYSAFLPLADGSILATIRRLGLARLGPAGRIVERPPEILPRVDEYRRILQDASGHIWVGNKLALLELEGQPGSLRLRQEALPELGGGELPQAVDLEVDASGRLWAGYARGLAWRDGQGQWRRLPVDVAGVGVRSFAPPVPGANEEAWIGFRGGADAFARWRSSGSKWTATLFRAEDGYQPEDTHFIKRDSRGWIWRGAPDGVHVSDGIHTQPNDWLHISMRNGLATESTDQYGFFEDRDGSVWIAGEEGIAHLYPQASWFYAPNQAPRMTRIEVNGEEVDRPDGSSGKLRIELGSLSAPAFRDYPFRYRLKPLFENWRLSRDGTLEFTNLEPGDYTLEAGFVGIAGGGEAAPLLTYRFRSGSPGSQLWIWLSVPATVGLGLLIVPRLPWPERLRYAFSKQIFILRRRLDGRRPSASDSVPTGAEDHSGETLAGRYHLKRLVSRGGFATVYEAEDRNGQGRVAIKMLKAPPERQNWVRDRYAHEIAALRAIRHRAVIPVLDSWITPSGEPCFVMPFLDGPTLRAALASGPLPRRAVSAIVRELGAALAEVHARGIVHRDIKPENIILSAPDRPVILDFGTAGLRAAVDELAVTTMLAGSFHYMAPERLTGHYSPACDIYSFGVIVLEMLTGCRLTGLRMLPSDEGFHKELIKLIGAAAATGTADILAQDLAQAYASKPQDRPGDAQEWAEKLAGLLERD